MTSPFLMTDLADNLALEMERKLYDAEYSGESQEVIVGLATRLLATVRHLPSVTKAEIQAVAAADAAAPTIADLPPPPPPPRLSTTATTQPPPPVSSPQRARVDAPAAAGRKREREAETNQSVFIEEGSWPSLHSPPTEDVATELSFIKTSAGDWCFEKRVKLRMIRNKEYTNLWQALINERQRVKQRDPHTTGLLITGHPGIGKSLLLDVLLSWSLNANPQEPVIVIGVADVTVFANIDGKQKRYTADRKSNKSGASVYRHLKALGIKKDAPILVLHDLKTSDDLPYQTGLVQLLIDAFNTTVVVSSSPKESNYVSFTKQILTYGSFVLPTLSLSEVQEFAKSENPAISDSTIAEYYDKVGGVLRHLESKEEVQKAVDAQPTAVKKVNFEPGMEVTSANLGDTNKIVQPIPSDDRRKVQTFDFVSANARLEWLKGQDSGFMSKLLKRFREAKDEKTRDVLGRVFEQFFLQKLQEGKKFCYSLLNPSPVQLQPWDTPGSLSVTSFPGDDPSVIKPTSGINTLYIPIMSPKFAVVDAVLVEADDKATLIQVTIADQHKPKLEPTKKLFNALSKSKLVIKAFVWVVDSNSRLSKKQEIDCEENLEYNQCPHYLCRFAEFMCWVCKKEGKPLCFPMPSQTVEEEEVLLEIRRQVDQGAQKLTKFENEIGRQEAPLFFEL